MSIFMVQAVNQGAKIGESSNKIHTVIEVDNQALVVIAMVVAVGGRVAVTAVAV